MPGRSRGRPMFDVRPETGPAEETYPGYPGYGGTAEPDDVHDDHDSRERESLRARDPRPSRGRVPAARDDSYDDEPLYARDYAPQGHDFGDPDRDPDGDRRERPANGRAAGRPSSPAPVDVDGYDDEYDEAGYEEDYDDDEYGIGDAPLSVPPPGRDGRPLGPADVEELDPSMTDALARVDLGSMQVPVPYGAELRLEPADGGRPQAVHLMLAEGRIAVSALAAPRSSGLWRELSAEIESSLRGGGARVRNAYGDWGRELHARTENAASVFIGADGPRWMVYGVATASLETVEALDVELRRVMRGVIVLRGKLPYPPRTVLPLTLPEHLADRQPEAARPRGASITVSVPAGSTGATPRPGATGSTPAPTPAPAPADEPAAHAGDVDASTRAIPQVARSEREDSEGPARRPADRRDAPGSRGGTAPHRAPRPETETGARPASTGRDGSGAGSDAEPGTATRRVAAVRPDPARPDPARPDPARPDPGHEAARSGRDAARGSVRPGPGRDAAPNGYDGPARDRSDRAAPDGDRYRTDRRAPSTPGRSRPSRYPDAAPAAGPAGPAGRDASPEPVEPPVRRDPAVTALPPADLVPDPATLRSSAARAATARPAFDGDRSGGTPPRGRGADRPRRGAADTPAADPFRAAGAPDPSGPATRRARPWPRTDPAAPDPFEAASPVADAPETDRSEATPPEPVPVSRMAIEDIPLLDVPLLEAELDAEPPVAEPSVPEPSAAEPATDRADPVLPRRRPRAGTNGVPAGGRRRREEAGPADRSAGASPWMSAEIAARPGGRHARPGGHRGPDAPPGRSSPLDPEPRNGSREPLTDWRHTARREPADGGALFSSPPEAGQRYRRNGNGHRPAGVDHEPAPGDDPTWPPADASDPGRHRR